MLLNGFCIAVVSFILLSDYCCVCVFSILSGLHQEEPAQDRPFRCAAPGCSGRADLGGVGPSQEPVLPGPAALLLKQRHHARMISMIKRPRINCPGARAPAAGGCGAQRAPNGSHAEGDDARRVDMV